jgi:hypothetical protein
MDSDQIVKFIKGNTLLGECNTQIMSVCELNMLLQKFNNLQTCKNCKSYSPTSDHDLMLLEDHEITLCMREQPEWGCKDFKENI